MSYLALSILVSLASADILISPYGDPKKICYQGVPFEVSGFPGSPFQLTPFVDEFVNPTYATATGFLCRTDGHCMNAIQLDVTLKQFGVFKKVANGCQNKDDTWFLTYGGSVPAPTILVPTGHETLVRFNNKIDTSVRSPQFAAHEPCSGTRSGRPFSVHHHGAASLAGYDGWADDETCFGESKDYIYPNNRPTTEWYHDHALHVTASNAYYGAAGFYVTSSKKKHGAVGEPWNLEDMEERLMMLSDKVIDSDCQLLAEQFGRHKVNLYADITLVSGIPWPRMPMSPKSYRFRFLNAAISRPFLIKLVDENNVDVGANVCGVIATDGGYRQTIAKLTTDGLLIGIAERYEMVCDLSGFAGKTLYFVNGRDDVNQKNVPYFCYTHLIAKLDVAATLPPNDQNPPALVPGLDTNVPRRTILDVITNDDYNAALQMAASGSSHRQFVFGRRGGHWVINGETWDTMKIAASDVKQNTWEVWEIIAGGGWFHPVHIHLIDFFILRRKANGQDVVRPYELMSAKDVLYLGPGNNIFVVARYGPHKGDYMFHCHNLVHEDNDMLRAFRITEPSTAVNAQASSPYVLNDFYNILYSNYKYADPVFEGTNAKPYAQAQKFNKCLLRTYLTQNPYRVFYPLPKDLVDYAQFKNPWATSFLPNPFK